jgi:hypothetical protein
MRIIGPPQAGQGCGAGLSRASFSWLAEFSGSWVGVLGLWGFEDGGLGVEHRWI